MTETMQIQNIRFFPHNESEKSGQLMTQLLECKQPEMFIQEAAGGRFCVATILWKHRSGWLCTNPYIQNIHSVGDVVRMRILKSDLPAFLTECSARMGKQIRIPPEFNMSEGNSEEDRSQSLAALMEMLRKSEDEKKQKEAQDARVRTAGEKAAQEAARKADPEKARREEQMDAFLGEFFDPDRIPTGRAAYRHFTNTKTPAQIEAELNERVIGQPELTKSVADFLYYHALRQLTPELPQRPMIIAGPSGSGKTQVWRAAEALYGKYFRIKIIDGTRITNEGWKGDYKLSTLIDQKFLEGGILITDEFDKLVRPKFAGGQNVSMDIQAEFLKLLEGEAQISTGMGRDKKLLTQSSKAMGFVFIGAFEELREDLQEEYEDSNRTIGFAANLNTPAPFTGVIEDEDYIEYGILPEVVGRIATKCITDQLSDDEYIQIINSPFSRVATLRSVFEMYGAVVPQIPDAEIRQLIATAKNNRTGVRWVSAQIENRIIASIRQKGLHSVDDYTDADAF